MRVAVWAAAVVMLATWSCGGDDAGESSDTASLLVGPEGGEVALANGGKVTIPPGALDEETEVKITKLELNDVAPLPATVEAAGKPYAFTPHGISFAQPVKIELPYEGDAASVRPMKLANAEATAWQVVGGSEKDEATRKLTMETTTFSVYVAVRGGEVSCTTLVAADVADGGTLAEDTCYDVSSPLTISGGTLTIEPGVRIAFGANGYLVAASGGSLNAVGTADKPVTFTSADPVGRWRGIRFDGSRSASNVLHHVVIENAGSSGWSGAGYSTSALLLDGNSLVDIQDSTIAGSDGQGITVYADAEMTFENNTLRDNAVAAWLHPNTVGFIGASTTFEGNTENVVRVVFGNNDAVATAQTWRALDVPFHIQNRFYVNAALTLAPGTTLRFAADASVIVQDAGALTATGTETEPITLGGVEDLAGYWKGLQIATASANNVFDYVVFENGGGVNWTGAGDSSAMVYLDGNSRAVFTHTTFRGSAHYGLWVPAGGDIAGFQDNTFTANARAMIVHPNSAGAIEASNAFSGNVEDKVRVSFGNTDTVTTAQTWADFDAPFYVAARTFVHAALSIAPGTELEFAQDASLRVAQGGSLNAAGTPAGPIVFRGGEDLVGYWQGISYDTVSASNVMTQVQVSNAGSQAWFGGANSTAAIHVTANGSLALTDVTFASSGGYAAIISSGGSISCSAVDDGGFQYYDSASTSAVASCP